MSSAIDLSRQSRWPQPARQYLLPVRCSSDHVKNCRVGLDNPADQTDLPPSSADGMEDFISDLEKYTVMDSGHWTQQEKPEEVNRVIINWLNRKIR